MGGASMGSSVVVLVRYRALPGREQTALHEISELVATVRAREPECGGIKILRHWAEPTQITLIEEWPSRETFLGPHMQRPHIESFIQRAGAFLEGPPDISFWSAVGGA